MSLKICTTLAFGCALMAAPPAAFAASQTSPSQSAQAASQASQALVDALTAKAQDESAMQGLYGNTVILTHPSGVAFHFHFQPTKTFTATVTGGTAKAAAVGKPVTPLAGTFKVVNRQLICVVMNGGAAAANICLPMGPQHQISDTWVIKPGDAWTDGGGNKYVIVPGVN